MTQTTILEKFKIIFEVSKSSKLFIAVIVFIILLALVALTTNRKNAKRGKTIYALVYASIIIALIVAYHNSLGKMFDYMMDNFFIVVYFPNVAVYLAAIIVTNIILWTSVFNLKTVKLVRTINVIVYGAIHYLLALVLNIITKNNLDIFSQISVYGNREAQAIIELSSGIFIIWVIFLIFYKIIRKYQRKDVVPVRKKVIIKKVRKLPDSINEVPVPLYVKAQPKKTEPPKTLTDQPVIIGNFVEQYEAEKLALAEQLATTKKKLELAEAEIKIQEEQIKVREQIQVKLEEQQEKMQHDYIKQQSVQKTNLQQEQAKLHEEQAKLHEEQAKLHEEQAKLQEAQNRFHQEQLRFEETKQKAKTIDATTAIMQNLDGMLTLEDYKVLATILKDKQRKKNAQKTSEEIRRTEQAKFAQLREAYKSVR